MNARCVRYVFILSESPYYQSCVLFRIKCPSKILCSEYFLKCLYYYLSTYILPKVFNIVCRTNFKSIFWSNYFYVCTHNWRKKKIFEKFPDNLFYSRSIYKIHVILKTMLGKNIESWINRMFLNEPSFFWNIKKTKNKQNIHMKPNFF